MRNLFGGKRNSLRECEDALNEFFALQVDHRPDGRNRRNNERTDVDSEEKK